MASDSELDILIAGVGHPLMGDDSLGGAVLQKLEQVGFSLRARLFYAGSAPLDILTELAGIKKLIVVDALTGVKPGVFVKKHFSTISHIPEHNEVESHGIGLVQTLCLARELVPDIDIIIIGAGIAATATPGIPLSDSLRERIPALIQLIQEEL
jgi:hydrogenase maturation protease